MSGGAVSAIILQWKQLVGIENADQLRDLTVALRKGGFSALELAGAVRLKNIMNQIGVAEESLREFLTETYNTCKKTGLQPYQIATCLGDLVAFGSIDMRRVRKSESESSGGRENLQAGQIGGRDKEEEEEDEEGEQGEEEEEEEEKEFNGANIRDFMSYPEHSALTSNNNKTKLGDSGTENLHGPRPPRLPSMSNIRTKRYLSSETKNCSTSRLSGFPATAMVKQKHEDPHSAVIADSSPETDEPSTPNNTSNWYMTARTDINLESIDLVALVDEAITKPILRQLNLEWATEAVFNQTEMDNRTFSVSNLW